MDPAQRISTLRRKAWALQGAGELEQALATFDEMIALSPGDVSLVIEKGVALFRVRRFADALATFEEAVARSPDHVTALTNQAKSLIELGREREAMAVYKQILARDANHVGTWLNCGLLMARLEKHDKALGLFDETVRLDPRHPDAWYQKGVAHWRLGAPEAALEAFEQASRVRPDFYELLCDRGRLYRELGRLPEAAASFRKALKLEAGGDDAELGLAEVLLAQGSAEEADLHFAVVVERDKDCAAAWDGRGRALDALGEKARGALNRGMAAMISGDLEAALAHLDAAVAEDPAYGAAWSNRGVVLNRLERYEDALQSYGRALDLEPDSIVIMQNIGTLLFRKLDRKDDAVRVYKQILRLEPGRWFEWPADIREAVDEAQ